MPSSRSGVATKTPQPANLPASLGNSNVLLLLIAFRIVNALTISTFFQPDEYFQSLEPAWQMAFGPEANAWITWEWRTQLRSSIHPSIFALVYRSATFLAKACGIQQGPMLSALLMASPKIAQALSAALCDYYSWMLAGRVYGNNRPRAWAALALTVASPWQWFCSTRTFSNCLETTLTVVAAYFWPWHVVSRSYGQSKSVAVPGDRTNREVARALEFVMSMKRLRISFLLAAIACIIRPTNILIWICLAILTLRRSTHSEAVTLVSGAVVCGLTVLGLSTLLDRLYYQQWTLPPLRFLYFNVVQSLATFYGSNRTDYYLTEGLPLLLTTATPFALTGLYQALFQCASTDSTSYDRHTNSNGARAPIGSNNSTPANTPGSTNRQATVQSGHQSYAAVLYTLATTVVMNAVVLSFIAHKEVRFLYPVLPFLHILAAGPLIAFLFPKTSQPLADPASQTSRPEQMSKASHNVDMSTHLGRIPLPRKLLLGGLLAVNISIAYYTSIVHQSGVISVLHHLREQHEVTNHQVSPNIARPDFSSNKNNETTVAFLMPCHSTPWRSHLIYPGINAWALTCEPPLDVPLSLRSEYLDEADQFYANPKAWLRTHMEEPDKLHMESIENDGVQSDAPKRTRRPWPKYLVFFEHLEGVMKDSRELGLLGQVGRIGSDVEGEYRECWRGFNTHWHDDWRRKGDVVVWCRSAR